MSTSKQQTIVRLKGGMGNQMFQYAFGQALVHHARTHNIELTVRYDISSFTQTEKKETVRPYYLPFFNATVETIAGPEVNTYRNPLGPVSRLIRYVAQKMEWDHAMRFSPKLLRPPYRSYYEGYWQSEKFFTDFADEVIRDFSLRTTLGTEATHWHQQITADPNAISIFYRRTDYVGHDLLDIGAQDYQRTAIKRMQELVPNGRFYVTSDDITWVKENADLPPGSVFVSSPKVPGRGELDVPIPPHEEMYLMAACKHNIIPNSTFAWWGAWLNQNPNKIVIAPKAWGSKDLEQFADVVPSRWIQV
jgi:hypothetical protein